MNRGDICLRDTVLLEQKLLQRVHCVVSGVHQGDMQELHYFVEKDYHQVLALEAQTLLRVVLLYYGFESVKNMIHQFGCLDQHVGKLGIFLEALKDEL